MAKKRRKATVEPDLAALEPDLAALARAYLLAEGGGWRLEEPVEDDQADLEGIEPPPEPAPEPCPYARQWAALVAAGLVE